MYLFKKIKTLLNRFTEPVDVSGFDHMSLSDIMDSDMKFSINGVFSYEPTRTNLASGIAARLKQIVSSRVNAPDLDISASLDGHLIECNLAEHNAEAETFVISNKLDIPYGYSINALECPSELSAVLYYVKWRPKVELDHNSSTLSDVAERMVTDIMSAMASFSNLKSLGGLLQSVVPVVDRVLVSRTTDDEWTIDGYQITPELLDGFMAECQKALDEQELRAFRSHLVDELSMYGSVDYDYPSVHVDTPEKWREQYRTVIEPAQRRRERCKDIIEEIKSNPLFKIANSVNSTESAFNEYKSDRLINQLIL